MQSLDRLIMNELAAMDAFDEGFEDEFDGFLEEAIDEALARPPHVRTRSIERRELLLHGTTLRRAQQIQATGRFTVQDTYFALGYSNRAVARAFAHRAASRYPNEGDPTLVIVSVPQATIQRLRQQGLLIPRQLQDPPAVRGRIEWVLSRSGVHTLNQDYEELRIIRLTGSPQRQSFSALDVFDLFDASERSKLDEAVRTRRCRQVRGADRKGTGRTPSGPNTRRQVITQPEQLTHRQQRVLRKLEQRLTPHQRQMAQELINEHRAPSGVVALNPLVAHRAVRGAVRHNPAGGDITRRDGSRVEIKTYAGSVGHIGNDAEIRKGLRQAGSGGELWIQVNTPDATPRQVQQNIRQFLQRENPTRTAGYVRVFGPQGQIWYEGRVPANTA